MMIFRTFRIRAARFAALMMAMSIAAAADRAHAASGTPVTLPRAFTQHQYQNLSHAILITIDPTWVEGRGYRPVKITATALKPSPADRDITLMFTPGSRWYSRTGVRVTHELRLPAGAQQASVTLAVPQYEEWQWMSIDTWVDDTYSDELSDQRVSGPSQGGSGHIQTNNGLMLSQVRTLIVDVAPPAPTQPGGTVVSEATHYLPPADLPTRWIDYSCLDLVCVSADELAQLPSQQPEVWQAIRQWLAAGGNLWVHGTGDGWAKLSSVEAALGVVPARTDGEAGGWDGMTTQQLDDLVNAGGQMIVVQGSSATGTSTATVTVQPSQPPPVASTPPADAAGQPHELIWRAVGMGRVVAVKQPIANWEQGQDQMRARLLLGAEERLWTMRHGVTGDGSSDRFWDWLVPGVAGAPVTAFRLLITVFVLAIGPLNYFLLKRYKRLHLLLITVPVSAVLVTAGLFVYALASDGVATRVRARSFTELDQRLGQAACWSRLSYYSGLAPGDGLMFGADTMMLPIYPGDGSRWREVEPPLRHIEWDGEQYLTRGWLLSRTPTQYISVRSRASERGLRFEGSGELKRVRNELETRVRHLFVRDDAGGYYMAEDFAAGESAELDSASEEEAAKTWTILYASNLPQMPADFSENRGSIFGFRRYYGSRSDVEPELDRNLLEKRLRERLLEPRPGEGERRAYVAIVDRSPEVDFGLPDVQEQGSFHVIRGTW